MRHVRRRSRAGAVTAIAAVVLLAVTGCNKNGGSTDPTGSATTASPSTTDSAGPSADPSAGPSGEPDGRRRVVEASPAGGLPRLTGDGALSDVPVDPGEMRDGMTLVAAHYAAPGAAEPVLFMGVDNVPEDTGKRREHLWRGMLDHAGWDHELGQPQAEPVADAGELGGSVECMLASLSESGNVICGWADDGTAGVALFPDTTLPEAGELFVRMRADLEKTGG
ncbi:hypothetical protein [Streptomyces sp. NPDC018031]|uniref:hypothetical protein n=1 Tax=Streptomyces sp. NPDC018031 TaxID=3365033 RepID=UPI0037AD881C